MKGIGNSSINKYYVRFYYLIVILLVKLFYQTGRTVDSKQLDKMMIKMEISRNYTVIYCNYKFRQLK